MNKILAILILFLLVAGATALMNPDAFLNAENLTALLRRTAPYAIMGIGVALVIVTGGIDLSIGSVIALSGCVLYRVIQPTYHLEPTEYVVESLDLEGQTISVRSAEGAIKRHDRVRFYLDPETSTQIDVTSVRRNGDLLTVSLRERPDLFEAGKPIQVVRVEYMNLWLGVSLVLLLSLGLGIIHGLLITKLNLQPFVVTLCGLLIYRGMARWITNDNARSFGTEPGQDLKFISEGQPLDLGWITIPTPFIIMLVIMVAAMVFLNRSIYGRYLLAMGRSEQAARYSGIKTDRMAILAYALCALAAGVAGIIFAMESASFQAQSHGNFYELYAIAAAVLGGCSLRGGEGSILGVVIAAALMRLIYNMIALTDIESQIEFVVLGAVILFGVVSDEMGHRFASARRRRAEAQAAESKAAPHTVSEEPPGEEEPT